MQCLPDHMSAQMNRQLDAEHGVPPSEVPTSRRAPGPTSLDDRLPGPSRSRRRQRSRTPSRMAKLDPQRVESEQFRPAMTGYPPEIRCVRTLLEHHLRDVVDQSQVATTFRYLEMSAPPQSDLPDQTPFEQAWNSTITAASRTGCTELYRSLTSTCRLNPSRAPMMDVRPYLFLEWPPSKLHLQPNPLPEWFALLEAAGRHQLEDDGTNVLVVKVPTGGIAGIQSHLVVGAQTFVVEGFITAPTDNGPASFVATRGALGLEYDASTDPVTVKRHKLSSSSVLARVRYLILVRVRGYYKPRYVETTASPPLAAASPPPSHSLPSHRRAHFALENEHNLPADAPPPPPDFRSPFSPAPDPTSAPPEKRSLSASPRRPSSLRRNPSTTSYTLRAEKSGAPEPPLNLRDPPSMAPTPVPLVSTLSQPRHSRRRGRSPPRSQEGLAASTSSPARPPRTENFEGKPVTVSRCDSESEDMEPVSTVNESA